MTLRTVRKWPQWWRRCSSACRCQFHDSTGRITKSSHTSNERALLGLSITGGHFAGTSTRPRGWQEGASFSDETAQAGLTGRRARLVLAPVPSPKCERRAVLDFREAACISNIAGPELHGVGMQGSQPACNSFHVGEHGGLAIGLTLTHRRRSHNPAWSRTLRCPFGAPSLRKRKAQARLPFVCETRRGLSM